jgi:uncharacterized cysteine cluster protein YcgN (CxxCxxCC family)
MGLNVFQCIKKTYDLDLKFIFTLEVICNQINNTKIKNYENRFFEISKFRNFNKKILNYFFEIKKKNFKISNWPKFPTIVLSKIKH